MISSSFITSFTNGKTQKFSLITKEFLMDNSYGFLLCGSTGLNNLKTSSILTVMGHRNKRIIRKRSLSLFYPRDLRDELLTMIISPAKKRFKD